MSPGPTRGRNHQAGAKFGCLRCCVAVLGREAEAAAREQASLAAAAAAEDRRRELEGWESRTRKVGAVHARRIQQIRVLSPWFTVACGPEE